MRSCSGRRSLTAALLGVGLIASTARPAAAAERYAVIVTGASGGAQYAQKYDAWRDGFVEWTTKYGREEFDCLPVAQFTIHLELSPEEREQKLAEDRKNPNESQRYTHWVDRYQNVTSRLRLRHCLMLPCRPKTHQPSAVHCRCEPPYTRFSVFPFF